MNEMLESDDSEEGSDEFVIVNEERLIRAIREVAVEPSGPNIPTEHVPTFLANLDKADDREHKRALHGIYSFSAIIVSVLVFILILSGLFLAYGKADLLLPIITAICGFFTGAFGGYGLGKSQATEKSE